MEEYCNRIGLMYDNMYQKWFDQFKLQQDNLEESGLLTREERDEKCRKYKEELDREKDKVFMKFVHDFYNPTITD